MIEKRPVRIGWRLAAPALAFAAALFAGNAASAAPLDKAACGKLAQDLLNMKALDVDKLMERGPAWAVAHLSPADLALVRQYIDLDEQMKFRCSAPSSLVHLKHLEDEDEDNAKPAAEAGSDKAPAARKQGENAERASPAKPAKAPQQRAKPAQESSLTGR
jgi:hypothetical protein